MLGSQDARGRVLVEDFASLGQCLFDERVEGGQKLDGTPAITTRSCSSTYQRRVVAARYVIKSARSAW